MLVWLGQSDTVNFEQGKKYTIVYTYSGVQCSAINVVETQDVVVGGATNTQGGLGFSLISTVVSQSGPSQCEVRITTERVDPTTLISIGPNSPFRGVPAAAKFSAVLDENGRDLFRAPVAPTPTPTPPPPAPIPPAPTKEKKTSPIVWMAAGAGLLWLVSSILYESGRRRSNPSSAGLGKALVFVRGRYDVWVYYAEDDRWVRESSSDDLAYAKQIAKELNRPRDGVRAIVEDSETGRVYK